MSDVARFFDAIARRYDRAYALEGETSRARLRRVLAELPKGARVLDLGVGTGRELPALLDAGHQVTGLDISREMLARTGQRARPIPLVCADLFERLPFDPATFDAVLALHGTLAHAPEPSAIPRLAGEVRRVLRPTGVFVAELPRPAWLDAVEAGEGNADDRRASRTGPSHCVYEDLPCAVSIPALILDEGVWSRAFDAAGMPAKTSPISALEMLFVARREH